VSRAENATAGRSPAVAAFFVLDCRPPIRDDDVDDPASLVAKP
jgi:hypothetical protein